MNLRKYDQIMGNAEKCLLHDAVIYQDVQVTAKSTGITGNMQKSNLCRKTAIKSCEFVGNFLKNLSGTVGLCGALFSLSLSSNLTINKQYIKSRKK
jgi:hypothetical protein